MPGPTPDLPRRRPGRRRRRALWLGAVGLLAIAGALGGGLLLLRGEAPNWLRRTVERGLARAVGGHVRLGGLELRPLALEARVVDLEIELEGNAPPSSVRLVVPRARLRLSRSALSGRLHLAELEASGVRLETEGDIWSALSRRAGRRPAWPALRIDRLRLDDARLHLDERVLPLDLRADDVALDAAWAPEARGLQGTSRFRIGLLRPPFHEPILLDIETRFCWRAGAVDLAGLHARGSGLDFTAEGRIDLWSALRVVGHGRMQAELEPLAALLEAQLPRVEGVVSGPFDVELGPEGLALTGELRAGSGRFGRLSFDAVRARTRYSGARIELEGLEAQMLGGVVRGRAQIGGQGTAFELAVEGSGLRAAAILDWLGTSLPLAARVDGTLDLGGAGAERASWHGHAIFSLKPDRASGLSTTAAGPGRLEVADGRARLVASDIELPWGRVGVDLALDLRSAPPRGRLQLEGKVTDAEAAQHATLAWCEALGLESPEPMRLPLSGAGRVRADIGLGVGRRLDLALALEHGAWAGEAFDQAELRLKLASGRLVIEHANLVRGPLSLEVAGALGLHPLSVSSLTLQAHDVDAAWLQNVAGYPVRVEGKLDGELSVSPSPTGAVGRGWLQLVGASVFDEPLERLTASIEVSPGRVRFDPLEARGPALAGHGRLEWDLARAHGTLELDGATIQLGRLAAVQAHALALDGQLDVHGTVEIANGGLRGPLELAGRDVTLQGYRLGPLAGSLALGPDGAELRLAGEGEAGWTAEGHLEAGGPRPFEIQIDLRAMALDLAAAGLAGGRAEVTGSLLVQGALLEPESWLVSGSIEGLGLELGTARLEAVRAFPVSLARRRLDVGPAQLFGEEMDVAVHVQYDLAEDRLDTRASGVLDLGLLGAFRPELRAAGRVELEARAWGALRQPEFSGTLHAVDGRLRWTGLTQALDAVEFTVRLDSRELRLEGLRARLGNGEIRASGTGVFEGFRLRSFQANIQGANVSLQYPRGLRGIYEGELELRGEGERGSLTGRVELLRGIYDEEFDFGRMRGLGEPAAWQTAALPDIALDVAVRGDGTLRVRNQLAQVDCALDLHFGGTLRRPELTGGLALIEGGKLVFRDVEYAIRSGALELVDPDRLDPYLTLRAETTVADYRVFLHVEGTAERFEYELTSEPSLPTADIIALLTTGRTLGSSAGTQVSESTGDLAAAYFAGALTDPLAKELKRVLRLERLRIDPLLLDGRADPTSRVTIGEEVADDLFVVFSTDLGGDRERRLYQVEWRATPKIGLTAERDNLGGVGGSVKFVDRFWWTRPKRRETRATEVSATPLPPSGGSRLLSVELEGVPAEEREELMHRIPLRVGEEFSRSTMFRGVEAIRDHYVRHGRLEARVDAAVVPEPDGVGVVYRVEPGPLTAVHLEGVTDREARQLRSVLDRLWSEAVFNDDLYQDSVERIREFFHARGFYAADVAYDATVEGGQRSVRFRVDRGQPVHVSRLSVDTGGVVPEERIRLLMRTRVSSTFRRGLLVPEILEEDLAAIGSLVRDLGYLEARVEPPRIRLSSSGRSAEVALVVVPGRRFSVGEVRFPQVAALTPEKLHEIAALDGGGVFTRRALLEAESRLRAALDERGYPEARVRSQVEFDGQTARIEFQIEAGPPRRIERVDVRGNVLTKERTILRELELQPGQPLSRKALLAAQHRLSRLGVFRSVRVAYAPTGAADPAGQRVDVTVEDAPPLTASLGLGYDSEARGQVNFALTHNNLGGGGRVLGLQGRASGLERRLELVAREPRLLTRRLPALLDLSWQEREETGFTERRFGSAIRVDQRFGPRWTGHARYGLQRVDLSDVNDPEAVQREKLEDLRLGSIDATLERSTQDSPFAATRGTRLSLAAAVYAQPLLSQASFVELSAGGSGVHTLSGGVTLAGAARVGVALPFGSTREVPISERFFAGGDSTLRGFARDKVGPRTDSGTPLGGQALVLLNQELRVPLWGQLRGVLFHDAGNVFPTASDVRLTDLRHVLGAGLRLETPIGPFRLEYGWKLDRESGESPGELFLAIGSAF